MEDDVPEPIAAKKRALLKKQNWEEFFTKYSERHGKPYEFREAYTENTIVTHPKFGKGFVSEVISDSKVEVTFKDARRVLVHNRKDMPGLPLAAEGDGIPFKAMPKVKPPTKVLKILALNADKALKVVLWPLHVRAWWRTLRQQLPPADLYHAFGILALPVALDLARDARAAGRRGLVVYDVIDAILDSNNYQNVPGPIMARYRRKEAGWVRRVDEISDGAIAPSLIAPNNTSINGGFEVRVAMTASRICGV